MTLVSSFYLPNYIILYRDRAATRNYKIKLWPITVKNYDSFYHCDLFSMVISSSTEDKIALVVGNDKSSIIK